MFNVFILVGKVIGSRSGLTAAQWATVTQVAAITLRRAVGGW
jgi:hypothetical protein